MRTRRRYQWENNLSTPWGTRSNKDVDSSTRTRLASHLVHMGSTINERCTEKCGNMDCSIVAGWMGLVLIPLPRNLCKIVRGQT